MDNYLNDAIPNNNDVLLVLGNGFDLNLGLKTSYADFIKGTFDMNEECEEDLCNYMVDVFKKGDKNWIDIENELKKYSRLLITNHPKDTGKEFKEEFQTLCHLLKKYLSKISDWGNLDSKEFDNIYKSKACQILRAVAECSVPFVASFNYTPFVKRLAPDIPSERILHIHGSLEPDSDIVFGVEDSAKINQKHIFLLKSHSRYQNHGNFSRLLRTSENIIFFGYSLGETDHSYFSSFFTGVANKKITFYYYNEEAYDNLIVQLMALTSNRLSTLKLKNEIEFIPIS